MGIYAGRTTSRQFIAVIHASLLDSGYLSMLPMADGSRVYKSVESDTNEFYIRIRETVSVTTTISVGFYKTYTIDAGNTSSTLTDGFELPALKWYTNNATDAAVAYIMNINKSRAIIQCEGISTLVGAVSSLIYVGMPKRYDAADIGPNFGGMTVSSGAGTQAATGYALGTGTQGTWRCLATRNTTNTTPSYLIGVYMPTRSYGWGGQLFFSPMIIGAANAEGVRGELDGLFVIEPGDNKEFQHGDTFVKDGKTYIILSRAYEADAQTLLPIAWYIMEVREGLTYGFLLR